jgi:hypothetical protein
MPATRSSGGRISDSSEETRSWSMPMGKSGSLIQISTSKSRWNGCDTSTRDLPGKLEVLPLDHAGTERRAQQRSPGGVERLYCVRLGGDARPQNRRLLQDAVTASETRCCDSLFQVGQAGAGGRARFRNSHSTHGVG